MLGSFCLNAQNTVVHFECNLLRCTYVFIHYVRDYTESEITKQQKHHGTVGLRNLLTIVKGRIKGLISGNMAA